MNRPIIDRTYLAKMLKSPISVLQELAQSKRLVLGDYTLVETSGQDHCRTFTYEVMVDGQNYSGSGSTKQSAKTTCAKNAVDAICSSKNLSNLQIKAMSLLPSAQTAKNSLSQINYVGQLNEFRQTHKYVDAVYKDDIPLGHNFCTKCIFAGFETKGVGANKKESKQDAARQMLELIKENDLGNIPIQKVAVHEPYSILENIPDEYIIQRYKQLTISDPIENADENVEEYDKLDEDATIKSWPDLKSELQTLGYNFTPPEALQTHPSYIVHMTINKGSMMGSGHTREVAVRSMVASIVKMLKDGYQFDGRKAPENKTNNTVDLE